MSDPVDTYELLVQKLTRTQKEYESLLEGYKKLRENMAYICKHVDLSAHPEIRIIYESSYTDPLAQLGVAKVEKRDHGTV